MEITIIIKKDDGTEIQTTFNNFSAAGLHLFDVENSIKHCDHE